MLPFKLLCSFLVSVRHLSLLVCIRPSLHISVSALYSSISLLICISPRPSLSVRLPLLLGQPSLSSHVGQSHLRADGKGVPLQVHLHIGSGPEQIPLCQRDG